MDIWNNGILYLILNLTYLCNYVLGTHLTHWGRVTHICVSKLIIIGSDNGLSPGRRQAIIWTNAGILLIKPLKTHFNEILIEIFIFSFKKIHLKMAAILSRSQWINTLRPRQNGRHFPDDIFKWIFLNENVWISINISHFLGVQLTIFQHWFR